MAKVNKPVVVPLYPSRFGSHTSMIDVEETEKLNQPRGLRANSVVADEVCETVREDGQVSFADIRFCFADTTEYVICKDEFGLYKTEKWRVDNNMVDPNRCAGSRIKIG